MRRAQPKTIINVTWFKRDLRVFDNQALSKASLRAPVLPIYVIEPDLWRQPDMSGRQWGFVTESLSELREELGQLGQPLVLRQGDVVRVLDEIRREFEFLELWSHEETGNDWTFQRDRRVAAWCRDNGVVWHEVQNHGVVRRLRSRDGWANGWEKLMALPVTEPPAIRSLNIESGSIPAACDLNIVPDACEGRQRGGRKAALERLESFLNTRGETYRSAMSSPLEGSEACSRLSPHLAWGTVSMREVAQATWAKQRQLKVDSQYQGSRWRGALKSFTGRLHWHCHFMQKLEDEPRIEFENFHSGYDGVRSPSPDKERLHAWAVGETGLPFVDACMRSLRATGWLNFRMRAMVMATASYHLWLHWREPGLELARLFTDYEPGIHWSQVQMQSGTTGINTVRIYNPVKQGYDQDPTGEFTRRWVPELGVIADRHLQEPWKADNSRDVIGKVYPERIVDHLAAARKARQCIWAVRAGPEFRAKASEIQQKHGSRKSGIPNRGKRRKTQTSLQMSLPLGK
jgi:deoxyribodipyrimidine photo-lyase